jgi:hypothetical protein
MVLELLKIDFFKVKEQTCMFKPKSIKTQLIIYLAFFAIFLSVKDRNEFFESRGFNKYMNDNNLSYNEKSVINLVSLLQTINCTSQLQSELGIYDFRLLCSYIQSDIIHASKKSRDIPIEIYVPQDRKRKNNDMNNSI